MTTANYKLRPFQVFLNEATNINHLYWGTDYSYQRISAVLHALAATSGNSPPPQVNALWGSTNRGQNNIATLRLPDFDKLLSRNLATLRRTSILYICSAFENALSGYYILSSLYKPGAIDSSWNRNGLPSLLANPGLFAKLKSKATKEAGGDFRKGKLKGMYSERIKTISDTFQLPLSVSSQSLEDLDRYQKKRHLIAHDQGLSGSDEPLLSVDEVLCGNVILDESEWKGLNDLFHRVIRELDAAVRLNIVTDRGISLAVARILERSPTGGKGLPVGQLRNTASKEWRISFTSAEVVEALRAMGREVSTEKAMHRRKVL